MSGTARTKEGRNWHFQAESSATGAKQIDSISHIVKPCLLDSSDGTAIIGLETEMASYVFMKVLESSARRYDAGINILSLGQSEGVKREIVKNYITVGDKVLEIGCGTGTLAILCAEKSASVTGFDVSSEMVDIARKKIEESNLTGRIELKHMGAVEMDKAFDDETFHKVVSTLFLSELYSDEQKYVLREAHRVLKHGGLIIIADEIKPQSLAERILQLLIRIPLVAITYILTQTSTRPLKDVGDLLADTGFEIIYQKKSRLDFFGLYVARKGYPEWDSKDSSEQL
jgi:ubiquinone/menaquinone biosynthesis C-methylase UbiE